MPASHAGQDNAQAPKFKQKKRREKKPVRYGIGGSNPFTCVLFALKEIALFF